MRKARWVGQTCVVALVAGGGWECSGASTSPSPGWTLTPNGSGSAGTSNLATNDASVNSSSSSGGSGVGSQQATSSGGSGSSSGAPQVSGSGGSGSSSGVRPASGRDAGHSGSPAEAGSESGAVVMGSGTPKIPQPLEACPQLTTGNVTVLGQSVTIWAGTKGDTPAPILFYWHGTGSSALEAQGMSSEISEITGEGGLVASFSTSLGTGTNTGDAVWYTDDFQMCDQILACAVQQLNIDTHQIYTAGCSAGGLQAGAMVYQRSSYLAASMPNSGGISPIPGLNTFDDPTHVPALITTHGAMGTDVVVLDFSTASLNECMDIKAHGGFAVDCNHGGTHCGAPPQVTAAQWQFCKDHPFGVSPEPYMNGLPSSFPSYCVIQ